MLRNYLLVAWRNLLRNRTIGIINLFGLSISVAFCLLLFYHVRWEQSFDTFHVNKDRLFRCEMSTFRDGSEKSQLAFPLVAGPDLQRNFPEVAAVNRFQAGGRELVKAGDNVYEEKEVVRADANFFQLFTFPLLKGDVRTALAAPENVVLSATVAKKYFGEQDPVGQAIHLTNEPGRLYRVTGVAADAPANSSIQFGLVLPVMGADYQEDIKDGFNRMNDLLMVQLKPGVDRPAFEKKMNSWVRTYIGPYMDTVWYKAEPAPVRASYHWMLRPLAECHYSEAQGWGHYANAKMIYQLLCLVGVILLLASLNYLLVTVSNAASRSQEVGVRKVMGAGRGAIILQSWLETQLVVGLAVGFGLLLSWIAMPLLHVAIGSGVKFSSLSWIDVTLAAVVLAAVLAILAGYYPALLISRLKPLSVMKSFSSVRINPRFSRVLVVVQFTCCVVLMAAAYIISRQLSYVMNKDLGFDKNQVLIIHNPSWDRDFIHDTKEQMYAFAQSRPDVIAYSAMNGGPTGSHNRNGIIIDGKQEWYQMMQVDYNYFELLKLKLVAGRTFSRDFPTDTAVATRPCVVNEEMMRLLGKDAQLGVYNKALRGTIIGIVKDYNFESLSKKIEPEQHRLSAYYADLLFRIRGGNVAATINAFEKEWKRATHNYPFSYGFLDDSLRQRYEADLRAQHAMEWAGGFAILIACMGLFGLSAIAAANRTKEIGIRKVLGASVGELAGMLARGFLSMVMLAILIAVPLAWWGMNRWLADFAYHIDIQWWMFAVVGLMAVGIALATVSFQVLRAARANPIDALRSE
ncbi:MAG TPA: ABC transporter permease [Puia sp.]|uniref:ABC transporter permease n=1 Tax=Puia sp. TaxID=2045100 RepID=UPI002CBAE73F|nr:ABC transporter permease [Puia sp.]HVU95933.1 ABC transporter permease [Puia sp.]